MTTGEVIVAAIERHELCDLMAALGPDAPTLCTGWTTRDLAAHLVLREHRPDAVAGIVLSPLARYTARVQRNFAQRPWPELVALVRDGPPWWSPLGLPGMGNAMEFFVHHEDVRRARTGWEPRPADPRRARVLWGLLLRMARMLYRHSPVGVVVRTLEGSEHTVRRGARSVTVIGSPEELLLHAFGRDEVIVEVEGNRGDVTGFHSSRRGM